MQHFTEINTFIDGVKNYFINIGADKEDIDIGAPYLLKQSDKLNLDFTGIISITGNTNGYIFFTSTSVLLKYILLKHSESNHSDLYLQDVVGEVANTIAGNARRTLGEHFHISPPKVVKKSVDNNLLNKTQHSYALPIFWKRKAARLIISLDDLSSASFC